MVDPIPLHVNSKIAPMLISPPGMRAPDDATLGVIARSVHRSGRPVEQGNMSDGRLLYLRTALVVFGLVFIFAVYPLTMLWPSGWTWGQGHSHYLTMIIGVYATLGVFLLLAARNPEA